MAGEAYTPGGGEAPYTDMFGWAERIPRYVQRDASNKKLLKTRGFKTKNPSLRFRTVRGKMGIEEQGVKQCHL